MGEDDIRYSIRLIGTNDTARGFLCEKGYKVSGRNTKDKGLIVVVDVNIDDDVNDICGYLLSESGKAAVVNSDIFVSIVSEYDTRMVDLPRNLMCLIRDGAVDKVVFSYTVI